MQIRIYKDDQGNYLELPDDLVLTSKSPQAEVEDTAKLREELDGQKEIARLAEEEIANLKTEVARLESEEHSQEIVAHWLNNLDMAEPEAKVELGIKLGLDSMFRDAELSEEKEPVAKVKEPEAPKSELELIGEFLAARRQDGQGN